MNGKFVVVTGGTRGIGKAIASLLAAEGAAVWAASRSAPSTCDGLTASAGHIRELYLDVTNEESVKAFFEAIDRMYGRIDVLVNSAGIGVFKPVEETTMEEWERTVCTNLTGTFLCSKEAFKRMKAQGGGRIINIGSVTGYVPLANNGAYGASKYAVRGFSHILNEEGKSCSVRVSVVNPGAVLTEITARLGFAKEDMLRVEDVAESVLDIARRPLHVRIDEVNLMPPKGVL